MSDRVLLLTPSRGLGGGIERYVETLEWAFAREGVDYSRVDLSNPGAPATGGCWLTSWQTSGQAISIRAWLSRTRGCCLLRFSRLGRFIQTASQFCAMGVMCGFPRSVCSDRWGRL